MESFFSYSCNTNKMQEMVRAEIRAAIKADVEFALKNYDIQAMVKEEITRLLKEKGIVGNIDSVVRGIVKDQLQSLLAK